MNIKFVFRFVCEVRIVNWAIVLGQSCYITSMTNKTHLTDATKHHSATMDKQYNRQR